jgi:hypothetical protein
MHPSVTNKSPTRYPEELNLTANLIGRFWERVVRVGRYIGLIVQNVPTDRAQLILSKGKYNTYS